MTPTSSTDLWISRCEVYTTARWRQFGGQRQIRLRVPETLTPPGTRGNGRQGERGRRSAKLMAEAERALREDAEFVASIVCIPLRRSGGIHLFELPLHPPRHSHAVGSPQPNPGPALRC